MPVPITLLTGFLGAGKTTLLNALLKDPALAGAAVVINEFGEIGIDHLLVEAVEGDMLLLATGCICCAARGDLMNAMAELLERRRVGRIAFDRIIVETSGIADPGPIINATLLDPALSAGCRLASVVTLVDALRGAAVLDRHPEAERQVAVADLLVLSKADLLPIAQAQQTSALASRLAALNPTAAMVRASDLAAIIAAISTPSLRFGAGEAGSASLTWSDHAAAPHGPHPHIQASILRAGALDLGGLAAFLEVLLERCGPRLLRLKGIVASRDDPARPLVIHAVQHMLHPAARLPAWPDGDRGTRVVVITQDLDPAEIVALWASFFGPPAIDRPDAAALSHPLERAGGLF